MSLRFCVGQHLANKYVTLQLASSARQSNTLYSSLFINTALVLWGFDLQEVPEAPIDDMAFTDGGTTCPLPFKILLKPRLENLEEMIESHAG